jgi:hypothetical protein
VAQCVIDESLLVAYVVWQSGIGQPDSHYLEIDWNIGLDPHKY